MNLNELRYLSKALAKSTSASVRLYQRENQVYYYSIYPMNPDPFLLYEKNMLQSEHIAGIITTDLFQFYGYVSLDDDYRIVIGPSSILTKDKNKLDNLLFLLDVKEKYHEEYIGKLKCAPSISAERIGWLLSFIASTINKNPLFVEDVFVETKSENHQDDIMNSSMQNTLFFSGEKESSTLFIDNYQNEKMLLFYIKNGQPEALKELFSAFPKIKAGTMANDTLRQLKNMGISCATVASRAAIEGGLNVQTAFHLSDLYIQKLEMLRNAASIYPLIKQMLLDFAERTKQVKYNCNSSSKLFLKCANYVSINLFNNIKIEEIAAEFGISRSRLSNQFHKQTGNTLTQYILQEKILESQRLLQFTNKSNAEIALHLAFSSQSHFQTVFKKYTGITPNRFKNAKSDL
ncbi:HTH-type transcriptional activator RhaR [Neobacillus rhizosphaerae]|uniref:HTH-type transcriptional activator RhaR n=1 Tax=Neobacillus rhizosphaerae TaxID=2880965 RepID=A0ABM9EQE2_9BACI|nr:helix-turn-helix domain-containing protein [Neobacillus rhizosphaerae]CAH2714821.1 HTH-type transcriptional activator RhaR [Neobacillus rhizosphaerae]